ncbi:MAG: BLUF domain-containing protein [Bosea sp.]|uniref:BLUF domain-containing protein n=1 Tax=Bosea sp. (in: a-proteobacteria) TaxID=1871050 RepID=UPI001AC485D1|nr:BLUF domain-containing protein [Bosea sp. (in: a-proteobacteria)]MBN9454033.1 BLUF domain-containing protein [Bosea sp. (in: a-proteobacteria)]
MSLIRLVYASESRLVDANRRAELDTILADARRLNDRSGITGFLLATKEAFAQVLEGPQDSVTETYGRIVFDPRHQAVRLLIQEPIAARSFPGWAMGIAERDETTNFIFGLYGVSPEQDLHTQPPDILVDLAHEIAQRHA